MTANGGLCDLIFQAARQAVLNAIATVAPSRMLEQRLDVAGPDVCLSVRFEEGPKVN